MFKMKEVLLNEIFDYKNGDSKLTKTYCNEHKGKYEVFTGSTKDSFAFIDTFSYEGENLSFTTDGEYAGTIQILNGKYSVGSHRTLLIRKNNNININYFKFILRDIIKSKYKKGDVPSVHWNSIKNEKVKVPINEFNEYDYDAQTIIANTYNFIEESKNELLDKKNEILQVKVDFTSDINTKKVKITDLFKPCLGNGKYTKEVCLSCPGIYPVYSGNTFNEFAKIDSFDFDGEYLTWAKDGLAGYIMYHNEKFCITNHRGILIPTENCKNIDFEYVKLVLEPIFRRNIKGRLGVNGKNEYTTLSKDMILNIKETIEIPVTDTGEFDLHKQKDIVYKMKKIDDIKSTVIEQIDYLINTSIEISF